MPVRQRGRRAAAPPDPLDRGALLRSAARPRVDPRAAAWLLGLLLVVLAVHAGAALWVDGRVRVASLALALVAAVLVWAAAHALDLGRGGAVLAAVLTVASPLALSAFASPGAAVAGLLVGPAAVLLVAALLVAGGTRRPRRSGAGPVGALALLLAVAPFVVPLVARATGPAHDGWGVGSGRVPAGGPALVAWTSTDPVLPVLCLVCAVVALALPGVRSLGAAALLAPALVAAAHLPEGALAAALPAAGTVVAAAAEATWHRVTGTPRSTRGSHRALPGPLPPAVRHRTALGGVAAGVAVAVVLPTWVASVHRMPAAPTGSPSAAATQWLLQEVPTSEPVAVDAGLYRQLAATGQSTAGLVPVSGGDGAPAGSAPADWVVSTPALRAVAAPGTWARSALSASRAVQVFGSGASRVEVRRLDPSVPAPSAAATSPSPPPVASSSPAPPPSAAPSPAGTPAAGAPTAPAQAREELSRNPALQLSATARQELLSGALDDRLVTLLALLVSERPVSVADFPVAAGDASGTPRRTLVVDGLNAAPLAQQTGAVNELRDELAAQDPQFRPTTAVGAGGGRLTVQLPPAP